MTKSKLLIAVSVTAIGGFCAGLSYSNHVQAAAAMEVETQVAGAAPTKVMIENDKVRVSLASYPQGFMRDGGKRRQYDQIIVWVDEGDYTVPRPAGAPATPGPRPNAGERGPESAIALDGSVVSGKHPPGTVVWHPKDSRTPTMIINKAFRSLYIEIKK